MKKKITIVLDIIAASLSFGMWMHSEFAGMFVFFIMFFIKELTED